jgi:hypothetical protein
MTITNIAARVAVGVLCPACPGESIPVQLHQVAAAQRQAGAVGSEAAWATSLSAAAQQAVKRLLLWGRPSGGPSRGGARHG